MPIETAIVRRTSNRVDRAELGRTVGVSPGKGELVLKHYQAAHEPSWFMRYSKWSRLGATVAGTARPVEHKSEDQRDIALDRMGIGLAIIALVIGFLGFWLWSAVAFVMGLCAIGYHFYSASHGSSGSRPPMPVYAILPQQGTQAHRLVETIRTEMTPVTRGSVVLLEEKVTNADGRLELHVRQRDTKSDEKRSRVYSRRFGSLEDDDISLGSGRHRGMDYILMLHPWRGGERGPPKRGPSVLLLRTRRPRTPVLRIAGHSSADRRKCGRLHPSPLR